MRLVECSRAAPISGSAIVLSDLRPVNRALDRASSCNGGSEISDLLLRPRPLSDLLASIKQFFKEIVAPFRQRMSLSVVEGLIGVGSDVFYDWKEVTSVRTDAIFCQRQKVQL